MALLQNLLVFIIFCLVLVFAGSLLVRAVSRMASFLRLSEFVTAFILMAFSTSLPELFVGIASALAAKPALSLGNVIGSNIADIAFVGGIISLIGRKIALKGAEGAQIKKQAFWMVLISALPVVLMFIDGELSRFDGFILVAVFLFYLSTLVKQRPKMHGRIENSFPKWEVVLSPLVFIFGLFLLFYSAEYVVRYGSALALDLRIPTILVGLFFIAIGTSFPELIFETTAVLKHHPEMALGDLLGSVVMNSTAVLGVTALIYPIIGNLVLFLASAVFMMAVAIVFTAFIHSARKLDLHLGIALLMLYVLFVIVELILKGVIAS
ncbi:MAG: sodium:calcium antiporter [Candidatus Woesearchaeota archaeon]